MRVPKITSTEQVQTSEGQGTLYRTSSLPILSVGGYLYRVDDGMIQSGEYIVHILDSADKLDAMAVGTL